VHIIEELIGSLYLLELLARLIAQPKICRTRAFGECAVACKTAIGSNQVQMGIILLKITKCVNDDDGQSRNHRSRR
jgi:hypothetical protein